MASTTGPNLIQNEDVLFRFDDSGDHPRWFDVDSSRNGPSHGGGEQPVPPTAGADPPPATPDRVLQTHLSRYQPSLSTHDGRRSTQFPGGRRPDGAVRAKNPLATQPMLIRRTASPSQHDLFALSLEPAFSLSSRSNSQSHSDSDPNNALPMLSLSPSFASASSSADALVQTPGDRVRAYTHPPPRIASQTPDEKHMRDLKGKGKERSSGDDLPPVLPPLGFSPPVTISSPSNDLWPDIGVATSSNVVASPSYIPRRRAYRTDGDDPVEADDAIEVDITEFSSRFPPSTLSPHSPLPRHPPESPRSLQRFVPALTRQPYIPPHHIPSRRHSFSNGSRPHLLRSSSDAALSPGMLPVQGAVKEKYRARLGSVLRSRTPPSLGIGSGIARRLFFRRRMGGGTNSEPPSAGHSRPMTPPPSLSSSFVPGIRLPPPGTATTDGNNTGSRMALDLDLPDASVVRMTSCFFPKCGFNIATQSSPTLNLNLNPNPNPNPATNATDLASGPSSRVVSALNSTSASPIPGTPLEFPQNLATLYAEPVPIPIRPSETTLLKPKGRSYSSPFPLPVSGPISALDIISTPQLDVFEPLRFDLDSGAEGGEDSGEEEDVSLFDELLPREVKLTIFAWVVWAHERDHERLLNAGPDGVPAKTKTGSVKWSVHKAGMGRNKWVGRDRGLRELIKLGRVSWRPLRYLRWSLIELVGIQNLAGLGL